MTEHYTEFEFDLAGPFFDQVTRAFEALIPAPLTEANIDMVPNRPGVYGLYHHDVLVYVGKADESLSTRLQKHNRTISGCKNIQIGDMAFKCVCLPKTWDPMKPEAHLVNYCGTNKRSGWNNRGFGSNDPGANRGRTVFRGNHFYKQFPINDLWVCSSIRSGQYTAMNLLKAIKDEVPFWFRFHGNRILGEKEDQKEAEQAKAELESRHVSVPRENMTARELLLLVAESLPPGWQATITPSHMLLYREVGAVYPEMHVIWPDGNPG